MSPHYWKNIFPNRIYNELDHINYLILCPTIKNVAPIVLNSILIAYSNTFNTYNIVAIMISGCAAHPTQTFLPDYKNAALS